MEDEFPSSVLARRLFPSWFTHQNLLDSMIIVREDRYDFSLIRHLPEDHPGFVEAKKRTDELLELLQAFQEQQRVRVQQIEVEKDKIESHIVHNELRESRQRRLRPHGGMVDQKSQTNEKSSVEEKKFDAAAANEHLYGCRERLLFEAVIAMRIDTGMKAFASRARLKRIEYDSWTHSTDTFTQLKNVAISLPSSQHEIFRCMERRMNEERERIKLTMEVLIPNEEAIAEETERLARASLSGSFKPIPFTHNPQHPHLPLRVPGNDLPEFCDYCQVSGHLAVHCKKLYADEEDENFCTHCQKDGHHRNGCWVLHPKLREEYLREVEKQKKKNTCKECGAVGAERRYCYKLHGKTHAATIAQNLQRQPLATIGERNSINLSNILNSAWDQISPQTFLTFTDAEIEAGKRAAEAAPRVDWEQKYCAFCDVYGHRDRDCTVPDKQSDQPAPPLTKKEESKWARRGI